MNSSKLGGSKLKPYKTFKEINFITATLAILGIEVLIEYRMKSLKKGLECPKYDPLLIYFATFLYLQ